MRDALADDVSCFHADQLDPEASRMAAVAPRDWNAFAAHWTRILSDETIVKQTILVDGHVAGNIVSFEDAGWREVGYWIGRTHWGKGVATRALSTFLERHVTARPLYARVAKHNIASRRVLEKCGFTIAGETRGDDGVEEYLLELQPSGQDEPH